MPKSPPAFCYHCGKPGTEADPISWRGNHRSCGARVAHEVAAQMQAKSGPYYDRWLTGVLAAATRRRLDRRAARADTTAQHE